MVPVILLVILFIFVLILLAKTIRVIPQGRAGIVERLGKFRTVLEPGLHMVVPIIDRVLPLIDVREQVVSFPSQSVITEDNLVVGIDTVVYFQVTSPKDATYEITNYIRAVDELTSATLRNVVGGLNLEQTLMLQPAVGDYEYLVSILKKFSLHTLSRTQWRSRCVQSVIVVLPF